MDITVTGELGVITLPEELRSSPASLDLQFISATRSASWSPKARSAKRTSGARSEPPRRRWRPASGRRWARPIPVTVGLDRATFAAPWSRRRSWPGHADTFTGTASVSKPLAGGAVAPQARSRSTDAAPARAPEARRPRHRVHDHRAARARVHRRRWRRDRRGARRPQPGHDAPGRFARAGHALHGRDAGFVVTKFWPLVLGAVILPVLVVGTPVALVVRARAKAKKFAVSPGRSRAPGDAGVRGVRFQERTAKRIRSSPAAAPDRMLSSTLRRLRRRRPDFSDYLELRHARDQGTGRS